MIVFLYRKLIRDVLVLIAIGHWCTQTEGFLKGEMSYEHKNNIKYKEMISASEHYSTDWSNELNSALGALSIDDVRSWSADDPFNSEAFLPSPYLNVSEHRGELCNRVCVSGEKRVCYFEFVLEHYQAMGAVCGECAKGVERDCLHPYCIVGDGVEKGVMSINRQVPGPAIQVCQDDLIIVDVHNHAHGTAAAIHWHGVHMKKTPYMDGMPFLTQCPISYDNAFRYQFYATEAGTQFYHSHAGHQKANGQLGALIIRRPKEPLSSFYDYDLPEHYILISDWTHAYAEQLYPGLPSSSISPDSVLINGRGIYTHPETRKRTRLRPVVYYVKPGKRYLFRLINSVSHVCPFQMQIEKHSITVIGSDSYNVLPESFDTLVSNAGERYDFVLKTNHTRGEFWIRVTGLGFCSRNPIESFALLKYLTNEPTDRLDDSQLLAFPRYEDRFPGGKYLNHPNATCWCGQNTYCVTELNGYDQDIQLRDAIPDYKFFLAFHNHPVQNKEIFERGRHYQFSNLFSNVTVIGAISNISLILPDHPLLTQPELIDESIFCDYHNKPARCAGRRVCPCTHRLKVELNSIVELIIVDETEEVGIISHPFHLHGYRFMVTGLGQDPSGMPMNLQRVKRLEKSGNLPRDCEGARPPFKDTVSIPSRGYAVIRFRANNPGFWLMHCHYEWHLATGMGLVMQVGDTSQMVKAPANFPKCGNYLPPVLAPVWSSAFKRNSIYRYYFAK